MAGGVDDVDLETAPLNRRALGENGDTAFALLIVGVHGAIVHAGVGAHGAGLLQESIDEGGLAVVDVRDDRDVTQFHKLPLGREGPTFQIMLT